MKKAITLAAIAAAAIGAQAATDGVADAAQSIATFTNTIGSIPARQIRVFGVQDAVMLPDAGRVAAFYGSSIPGVADAFCVGDTTGAAVKLTFASAGIAANGTDVLVATNATTGATLTYHQSISINNAAFEAVGRNGVKEFEVPAGATQTDLTACTTPNVRKSIVRQNGVAAPATNQFTDIVTITATPV